MLPSVCPSPVGCQAHESQTKTWLFPVTPQPLKECLAHRRCLQDVARNPKETTFSPKVVKNEVQLLTLPAARIIGAAQEASLCQGFEHGWEVSYQLNHIPSPPREFRSRVWTVQEEQAPAIWCNQQHCVYREPKDGGPCDWMVEDTSGVPAEWNLALCSGSDPHCGLAPHSTAEETVSNNEGPLPFRASCPDLRRASQR